MIDCTPIRIDPGMSEDMRLMAHQFNRKLIEICNQVNELTPTGSGPGTGSGTGSGTGPGTGTGTGSGTGSAGCTCDPAEGEFGEECPMEIGVTTADISFTQTFSCAITGSDTSYSGFRVSGTLTLKLCATFHACLEVEEYTDDGTWTSIGQTDVFLRVTYSSAVNQWRMKLFMRHPATACTDPLLVPGSQESHEFAFLRDGETVAANNCSGAGESSGVDSAGCTGGSRSLSSTGTVGDAGFSISGTYAEDVSVTITNESC